MDINSWIYKLEKIYKAKCLLLYKYEGGVCSVLLSDNDSYKITYTATLPMDDPETDYKSNTEKEKFDLSLIEALSILSANRFLSRRVGFIDRDFYGYLSKLKKFKNDFDQEVLSMFFEKCQLYFDSYNNS